MKKKAQAAIVVAVIVILAVAVVALARANKSDTVVETGSLAVTRQGKTLKVFTMAEVKALPSVTAEKTIRSSNHGDEKGSFTGVPLRVLLGEVSPSLLDEATMVVTRASDGFVSSLDTSEVAESDKILLTYARDGRGLGTSKDGGSGPFRLIVLSDPYGNRCTKWLNEIEIQ